MPVAWITDPAQLRARFASRPARIGLDTEFIRERTYWPQLALVQIALDTGDEEPDILLVDPLASGMTKGGPLLFWKLQQGHPGCRERRGIARGDDDAGITHEESPLAPGNIYERTKVAAERLVREFGAEHKLPWTILRPADVYGPRVQRLLKLFKGVAAGRFPLFGAGEGRRHMIYVDDLVSGFFRACERESALETPFFRAETTVVMARPHSEISIFRMCLRSSGK